MIRMYVRHTVEDFDAWQRAYDEFAETRTALGVRDDAFFQGAEHPEDVTVWHDFEDLETARSFVKSDQLRQAMERAGVLSDPQIWFVEREHPNA